MTIWIRKLMIADPVKVNNVSIINFESTTIATFTKLLVIRIVASKRSGTCRCLRIILLNRVLFSFNLLICDGESEKYATSLPEINPDSINRITRIKIPMAIPTVNRPVLRPSNKNAAIVWYGSDSKDCVYRL